MTNYKQKTIFENRYCLSKLKQFETLVKEYFKNVKYHYRHNPPDENDKALEIRTKLNNQLHLFRQIVKEAGISYIFLKYRIPVDLIMNIFRLYQYRITDKELLDIIEQAIGVYTHDKSCAIMRTLNPLFWLNRLFGYIATIPFRILQQAGFDSVVIETSFLGKIIKLIIYLLSALASILTIYKFVTNTELF